MSNRPQNDSVVIKDARIHSRMFAMPWKAVATFLPIIGFEGLGVWTVLERQAQSGGDDTVVYTNWSHMAQVGQINFDRFKEIVGTLEWLELITITLDDETGKTVIVLCDPPHTAPALWQELVATQDIDKE